MALFDKKNCPVCDSDDFSDFIECTDFFVSGEKFKIKECVSCGFKITDQIPDEESIAPYYQSEDYISHSDTSAGIVNRLYHIARDFMLSQKRKIVSNTVGIQKGKMLDIGAGTGYFAAHMKQHGWDVTGTEKSSVARDFSKKELNLGLIPAESIFGLEENSFETITLWHVMEHFHNLEQYILEISRLLKSDGALFVALPNHQSFDAKHYKSYWAAFDVPRHIWHFAPNHVQQIFENAGFKIVRKHRMHLDSFYISIMSEKYKKSKIPLIKGVFWGKISWLVSLVNKDRCSSLIYVLKKS